MMILPRFLSLVGMLAVVLTVAVPTATALTDPTGDAGSLASDITSFEASGQGGELRLKLTAAEAYGFAGTQFLIDTDLDASTGHTLGSIGADMLIENDLIYTFDGGDQSAWSWSPNGSAVRSVEGNVLNLSVPDRVLGSRQVAIVARTLGSDYSPSDRVPDDSAMLVNLKQVAEGSEATGDAVGGDASRDLTDIQAMQQGDRAVVKITTAAKSDFANTLVFIDADRDSATGYQPDGDANLGFDFLITGGSLTRHSGTDPAAWNWETIEPVDQNLVGHTLTLSFNPASLQSHHLQLGVWNMSSDWMSRVDRHRIAG